MTKRILKYSVINVEEKRGNMKYIYCHTLQEVNEAQKKKECFSQSRFRQTI